MQAIGCIDRHKMTRMCVHRHACTKLAHPPSIHAIGGDTLSACEHSTLHDEAGYKIHELLPHGVYMCSYRCRARGYQSEPGLRTHVDQASGRLAIFKTRDSYSTLSVGIALRCSRRGPCSAGCTAWPRGIPVGESHRAVTAAV